MAGESVTITCPNCAHDVTLPWQVGNHPGTLHRGRLPLRIVDLLETDAPLTITQIAAALEAREDAVKKAVQRLQRSGRISQEATPGAVNGYPGPRFRWRLS
jgi:predicted ArsR family transcriptional regulator